MKLYQLLQSFEFEEIFPTVNVMFPNAQLHRDIFEKAFDMLCNIQPITSKKVIKFELMEDPNSNDMFVGANDSCFQSTWDVCLGKEIKKGKGADLNDVELAANCLLNVLCSLRSNSCWLLTPSFSKITSILVYLSPKLTILRIKPLFM